MRFSRKDLLEMLLEVNTDLKHHLVKIEGAVGRTDSQNLGDAEYHIREAIEAIDREIVD